MAQYAELLALRFDAKRTRHAYYRAMRVLHEHFQCDPATLEETHLRDYLLHIKLHKHWKPKTIRQTLACAKLFFVEVLQRPLWRVFPKSAPRITTSFPPSSRVSRWMISWAAFACGVIARRSSSSTAADYAWANASL